MKVNKTVVAPIVSVLALVLGNVFHVTIGDTLQGQITDIVCNLFLLGIAIEGIFKNHAKE